MLTETDSSKKLLITLINASAGNFRQYQITFWAQLTLGYLYSFGYFNSPIAGFILGFAMPVLWIFLTYRYVLEKSKENIQLPFPRWMQKNPGNTLVIVFDIIFLALIWFMILAGFYDAIWVKVLFTMLFPILTLSMLRNMVIYPFQDGTENNENKETHNNQQDG